MKRALLALLFLLATSVTLFTQGLAADNKGQRSGPAIPHFLAHDWHVPPHDPKAAKCFETLKAEATCLREILHSFLRRKPSIGPDCCASIKAVQDDCSDVIFGKFNNPLFARLLKEHCSNKGGAAPAAAPAPA